MKNKNSYITTSVFILLFIILDQVSKVIFYTYFPSIDTYLIDSFLGFRLVLNKDSLSFLNRVLHLNVPTLVLTILNLFLIVLICFIYKKLSSKRNYGKMEKLAFIFIMSGCICSLLDKELYGGSYDFIIFFKWIIDLKDIYLTISEVLILICVIKDTFYNIKKAINEGKNNIA